MVNYQDVLALLGVGSAHPGGFAGTISLVNSLPIKPGSRVLEVGCGTGRTACYLEKQKCCQVTAVDIRETMIEKARMRAIKEGASVQFLVADALNLPFEDHTFDVVFVESVTVFLPVDKALKEYCRVTKPDGLLYDREMCQAKPHPPSVKRAIQRVYGAKEVPSFDGWVAAAKEAGYRKAGLMQPTLIPAEIGAEDIGLPDFNQEVSPEAYSKQAQLIVEDNMNFMKKYHAFLGFAVVYATK